MAVPFTESAEITVNGHDEGTIRHANALASYGEGARMVRGANGKVKELWFGGTKFLPQTKFAAELKRRYKS